MSSSDMRAAIDDLDRCDIATLLHHLLPRLDAIDRRLDSIDNRLDAALETILERTAPKSECAFCGVDENRDSHHTGRCSRFKDPVSRTAQAAKLQLCLCCLKPTHEDQCDVKCGACGLDHNVLLCHQRRPHHQQGGPKRPRH
ncbi:hypothetical protein Y032_0046g1377 [Ancylostoma ceylanicum]|uniref:Uncharacterized protein n=1 Tax=Ancylostoma ceylanicum TaxID=53326 RepID=A0A016UCN7_9BILA|nr:hypothetical protein Y032_0046g1377 [Ancylostoma ceylanicum]